MKKEDLLSILITFVMGAFIGGYLYLTQTAPLTSKLSTPNADLVDSFSVEGSAYGACAEKCPAFRVDARGTYRYFHYDQDGRRIPEDGELPLALRSALRKQITADVLSAQSESLDEPCAQSTTTPEARFEIELEGEWYTLDSCKTRVQTNSQLWQTLKELWLFFAKFEAPAQ